jgi:hypothetical protein
MISLASPLGITTSAGLLALYGKPLAPFALSGLASEQLRSIAGELDPATFTFVPITPLEKLMAHGELPQQHGLSWQFGLPRTSQAIGAYLARTGLPSTREGTSGNLASTPCARASHLLAQLYAGWHNTASHRLAAENPTVSRIFMPMMGALLCIAKDRAHFLSLISGKPLPPDGSWQTTFGAAPSELFATVKKLPRDITYTGIIPSCISAAISRHNPKHLSAHTRAMIEEWFVELGRAFYEKEPGIESTGNPLLPLAGIDILGLAGPLYSEKAYRMHRHHFLRHHAFLNNIDVR